MDISSKKDLTNVIHSLYNGIGRKETGEERNKMTGTKRRIEGLKRDIEKLRRMLRGSGLNRSTLHNVKFNAQKQTGRYDIALELSDKEDELEGLESLKIKGGQLNGF